MFYIDIKAKGIENLTTESLKCPNAPQKPNGSTYGFSCCWDHVKVLINKGLRSEQCDNYIDWRWCRKKIKKYEKDISKYEKDPSKKEKVKELKQKINDIEKYITKHFKTDDIMDFTEIVNNNHVTRKSERIKHKTHEQKASYIECMVMENDNELLDNIEEWLTDKEKNKNIDPQLLHFATRLFFFI